MSVPVAAQPGQLPRARDAVVAGVKLPPGRLIAPDPKFASVAAPSPVLWIAADAERQLRVVLRLLGKERGGAYWNLVAAFPTTGLWPVMLESLRSDSSRPWESGELDPAGSSAPEAHDVVRVLENRYAAAMPLAEDIDDDVRASLDPVGVHFPGLAPPSSEAARSGVVAATAASLKGRLGLIPVRRPADAVAAIGWSGPGNHYPDIGMLAAILRSWEDRFGAVVVGIGFDTLTLAVERPVAGMENAARLAAEHLAACSDNIFQGVGGIRDYAKGLIGASEWQFWWD